MVEARSVNVKTTTTTTTTVFLDQEFQTMVLIWYRKIKLKIRFGYFEGSLQVIDVKDLKFTASDLLLGVRVLI